MTGTSEEFEELRKWIDKKLPKSMRFALLDAQNFRYVSSRIQAIERVQYKLEGMPALGFLIEGNTLFATPMERQP